jgi:hypothetical protein
VDGGIFGPGCVFGTLGVANSNPTIQTVAAPGTGGATTRPDLIAVTITNDGTTATAHFQFDSTITFPGGHPAAGDFFIGQSDNNPGCSVGAGATITPATNTVNADLTSCLGNLKDEYYVWADARAGSVQNLTAQPNPSEGVPTGGNSGAFANGFTTGPDAFSTTFDNSTNQVNVVLDQRFFADSPANIGLLDDTGDELPVTVTNVAGGGSATAGPVTTTLTFSGDISGARSLWLAGPAFLTAAGYANVPQILAPPTAAKHLAHKHGHVKWHHATKVHSKRLAKRLSS